jgi:hypothetical protein
MRILIFCEEQCCVSDFLWCAETAQGYAFLKFGCV